MATTARLLAIYSYLAMCRGRTRCYVFSLNQKIGKPVTS